MKLKLTSKIAEIAGAFAADGCLQKDYLCMWGNITEDRQYYQKTIIPLFETIFNTKINLHEKESNSVYGFYLCRKKVVDFFSKELNFPIGSKSYVVEVPQKIIQSKNKKIFAAFIRGFADCDGSLSFSKLYGQNISKIKNRKHVYPRIFLKSVSYKLINQISFMLTFIEINHTINIYNSKKINEKPCSIITIRGEKRLKK